ncbi:MAG TPA: DUF4274 domain-containing protein [Paenibacillus sp.]
MGEKPEIISKAYLSLHDGPEPIIAASENQNCADITLLDMYELMDGDNWLEMDDDEIADSKEDQRWKQLTVRLRERLDSYFNNSTRG